MQHPCIYIIRHTFARVLMEICRESTLPLAAQTCVMHTILELTATETSCRRLYSGMLRSLAMQDSVYWQVVAARVFTWTPLDA